MAGTSTGLLVVLTLLMLSTVITRLHARVYDCGCQSETFCQNGCNCSSIDKHSRLATFCARGYTYRCNGTTLDKIPDVFPDRNVSYPLCAFEFTNSMIVNLQNRSFSGLADNLPDVRVVILTENRIAFIDSDAFYGLGKVKSLNLTANNITHSSFGNDVFKPLTGLETLSLKSNKFTSFQRLDVQFRQLTNLVRLYIDGCRGCELGPDMTYLNKLRYLSFSGRESRSCDLGNMSATMFENVKRITHLYVSSCNVDRYVDELTFAPLKNIQLLDISYNDNLLFEGMNRCLSGLRGSTTLYELNVNHIHQWYERGTILRKENVDNFKTLKNLTILHMDLNKLEVLELGILQNKMFPDSLRNVTLTGNRLTYGMYFMHMFMLSQIHLIDISRQHINLDPFIDDHSGNDYTDDSDYIPILETSVSGPNQLSLNSEGSHAVSNRKQIDCFSRNDVMIVPKDLKFLKWRKSFLYFQIQNVTLVSALSLTMPLKCALGSQSLTHLDFSFNLIYSWQGPVSGVSNIAYIDLSLNYCENVSMNFFDGFTGLQWLNVTGNFLGPIIKPCNAKSYDLFKALSKLNLLDLSVNKICKLDSRIFQNLTELHYLNMTGNMMEDWTPSLENSHCLRRLDLSFNKFARIPESLMSHLDWVVDTQSTQCNWKGNVSLDLSGNPIECTCSSLPFLKWMVKTNVHVEFLQEDNCHLAGGSKRGFLDKYVMDEIITILENECVSYTTFIIICVVIFTCFTTTVVSVLVYTNRWRLRYWYYHKSRRRRHKGFDQLFENDAFISCTEDDTSFIKHKLLPALEGEHELKCWVSIRNSCPGASIAENLSNAIYSSRKTVMIISRKYLRNNWCDYEMNMAQTESVETKRKLMIFVLYDDIPSEELPINLLRLFKSEVCLEYPKHPQNMETFWSSLAEAITNE